MTKPQETATNESIVPSLSRETWEYLELRLWSSFSKKLWTLVTAILTVFALLAAFGMNTWIKWNVEKVLENERQSFKEAKIQYQASANANLLAATVSLHLRTRLLTDIHKYQMMVLQFGRSITPETQTALLSSPEMGKLFWPLGLKDDSISGFDQKKLDAELVDFRKSLRSKDDLKKVEEMTDHLEFVVSHIVALRAIAEASERIVFTEIKADPVLLTKLYEKDLYPAYAESLRKNKKVTLYSGTGEFEIESLWPDASSEFSFLLGNPLDAVFKD
jgi:hypothetical protein